MNKNYRTFPVNRLSPFLRRLGLLVSLLALILLSLPSNVVGQVAIPLPDLLGLPKLDAETLWTEKNDVLKVLDESLFIGRPDGLWVIGKDDLQAKKIESVNGNVYCFEAIGDQLFVGTGDGLWTVSKDGNRVAKIGPQQSIIGIKVIDDHLFVRTELSLFIVSKDGKQTSEVDNLPVSLYGFFLEDNGDQLFVSTTDGLWFLSKDGNQAKRITSLKDRTFGIKLIGDRLYVNTVSSGPWIVSRDGKQANKIEGLPDNFYCVELVGDRLFFGLQSGLWVVSIDGRQGTKVESVTGSISSIKAIGDQLYIGTFDALWIVNKDGGQANKLERPQGSISAIEAFGDYVFLNVSDTLYLFDPRATIKTELVSDTWWLATVGKVAPSNWLPTGNLKTNACYSNDGVKCDAFYNERIAKHFKFAKNENMYSEQGDFTYPINWGKNNEVKYWVTDDFKNVFLNRDTYYVGIPSQYSLATLPLIISVICVLGCFVLAPKVDVCHSAIMNPWLRKYFSLGSVPLLLSVFPSLRRYVLGRYATRISKDKEFSEWKTRFVSPDEEFLPENFGRKLDGERRLILTGQSGIGKTSFFKYLTARYVSNDKPELPYKVFPVYISLTNYGGNSLEELVYNQLFAYGKITDKELAPMFLEQGGLMIFLDGVNEVQNVSDRQKLSEFVEKYWTANYMCLSSQQSYPEIDNIPKLQLKTLTPKKIREFIGQRIDNELTANNIIKSLTDDDYQLYSVPRDLEFGIAMLQLGHESLPKSRTELYKTIFSSLFSSWKERGNADARDDLCKHAYEMIAHRKLAFDSVEDSTFKEITADLFDQKFLIRREGAYNFRHDLIRSFLAAEYFYLRWPNLLAGLNGKLIDSNWLEMLKFSCESIGESIEIKNLLYDIMEKSIRKELVKSLFEWLKSSYPAKCKSWENEFYAKYGQLDFT